MTVKGRSRSQPKQRIYDPISQYNIIADRYEPRQSQRSNCTDDLNKNRNVEYMGSPPASISHFKQRNHDSHLSEKDGIKTIYQNKDPSSQL